MDTKTIILLIVAAPIVLWIFSGFVLFMWGLLKGLFNLPARIKENKKKKKQEKELEESYLKADLRRRESNIRIGALYLMQDKDEIISGKYASPTIMARAIWEITEIHNEEIYIKDILGWRERCVNKYEIIHHFQNVDNIFDTHFPYKNTLLSDYERAIELLQERYKIIKRRVETNEDKGKD